MMFSRSLLLALAAPLLAFAQDNGNPNPFKINGGLQATAGEPLNLEWTPTTQGTVSLILRSGSSNNLAEGTTIASKIPNSGSYSWTPNPDTTRGSDYTIEIVSDSDSSATNYTPYFVLESDNTVASSTPILSSGAPTTSLALSTASPTASPSAFPTTSNGSMTTSASGSSASSTGSSASMTSSGSSASRSSSATGSAASSASAGIQTTSASQGAAPRATAMVGMLGVVALGALAL